MLPNQAFLKPELRLDDVVHRVRFGALLLLEVVVTLPVSRSVRVIGLHVAKHDLRALSADHAPHRAYPIFTVQVEPNIRELDVGMQTFLHTAIVAPGETMEEALNKLPEP